MKITNAQAQEIAAAINAITHGAAETVKGETSLRPYNLPFRATYAMARTLAAVKLVNEATETARKALFEATELEDYTPDASKPDDKGKRVPKAKEPQFLEDFTALLEMETEVALHMVKLSDMEAKSGQQVPPGVLALLFPMISDDPPAEAPAAAPAPK